MKLEELNNDNRKITLIVCAGFEERALKATERLSELRASIENYVVVKFGGPENGHNELALAKFQSVLRPKGGYIECKFENRSALSDLLKSLDPANDLVVFDITGCSRSVMLVLLSEIYDLNLELDILYTEAKDYYPTFADYEELSDDEHQLAFIRLNMFEESKVLHSSHCYVESFESFPGRMLPNYPFFLITFLPFKRGRLSAILQSLESQKRIFIRGQPIRDDLKWRGEAVDIPNADLIEEGTVVDLETLDWRKTFAFLEEQYHANENRFRYNFIVAPLGSKMQTIACGLFAKLHSDVRLITSTPKHHYPNSYSIGAGETFLCRGISAKALANEYHHALA
jgi:hypothetical protein